MKKSGKKIKQNKTKKEDKTIKQEKKKSKRSNKKLNIGIFAFSGCEGCQLSIIDLFEKLSDVLKFAEIGFFKLAQEDNKIETMDIAFIEGAITTKEEAWKLEDIREQTKFLVAIGECAVSAGVPAMRNSIPNLKAEHILKKTLQVDEVVHVDYRLRGCPIDTDEFTSLVSSLAIGKIPREINSPVCKECTEQEIDCFLLRGIPCMGPVTCMGCNALCPSIDTPCEGCRGMTNDANINELKKKFMDIGLSPKETHNLITRFSNNSIRKIKNEKTSRNKKKG